MKSNFASLSHKLLITLCLLIIIGVFQSQTQAQELSAAQKEVWELEENFWNTWKDRTSDSLTTFYHKEAVIWSSSSAWPKDRSFTGSPYYYGVGNRIASFELTPHEIRNFGNVAVVQYEVKVNSFGKQLKLRISSSWMKQDGKWVIIGAMEDSCSELPKCP